MVSMQIGRQILMYASQCITIDSPLYPFVMSVIISDYLCSFVMVLVFVLAETFSLFFTLHDEYSASFNDVIDLGFCLCFTSLQKLVVICVYLCRMYNILFYFYDIFKFNISIHNQVHKRIKARGTVGTYRTDNSVIFTWL